VGAALADVPLDQGILATVEALLDPSARRSTTACRRCTAASWATSATTWSARWSTSRTCPPTTRTCPTPCSTSIGELAAFDHWRQQVTLLANSFVTPGLSDAELDARYDAAVARLARLAADGASPLDEPLVAPPDPTDPLPDVTSNLASGAYEAAVEASKEHILAGRHLPGGAVAAVRLPARRRPVRRLPGAAPDQPEPVHVPVPAAEVTLVGSSPEPMVQLLDGEVISRPIAGTRYRGQTEEEDRRLGAELREHPKEVAEHVMLVDLARNDVGRVVRFGTERVTEMMTLERYSHVMHLTSEVRGTLAEGLTPIDVLRATLPAGTVSGAPKVRAMEIIDDFEPTKRGPYAGVVGYLDFSGNIDTAIAIRTMVCLPDGRACVQAGAGVVADSVPAHEELETRNKARALLAAVPAARRMTAARRAGTASD
jgi:anthranilate synthase component 1